LGRGMMGMRETAGFTLIEVVVVVAVIALLAAILAPQIAKHMQDAKVAKQGVSAFAKASAYVALRRDLTARQVELDGIHHEAHEEHEARVVAGGMARCHLGCTYRSRNRFCLRFTVRIEFVRWRRKGHYGLAAGR